MPYCASCGAEVSKSARFCTKCGANQAPEDAQVPPAPPVMVAERPDDRAQAQEHERRGGSSARLLRALIAGAVVVLVLAIAVVALVLRSRAASSPRFVALDMSTGVMATLSSPRVDTADTNPFDNVRSNQEVLAIRVVLMNRSHYPRSFNQLDFTVIDDRGKKHESTEYFDQDKLGPALGSGLDSEPDGLQPGKTQVGEIAYHIPWGTKSVTVTWNDAYYLDPPAKLGTFTLDVIPRPTIPVPPTPTVVALPSSGQLSAVRFEALTAAAVDAQGNVYLTDGNADRVFRLSPRSNHFQVWGRMGSGPLEFDGPDGVTVDRSGNIYVADGAPSSNARIQKFSPSGKVLAIWGSTPGKAPGRFDEPGQLALDAHNNLYVVDANNSRMQKLSPAGKVLGVWGSAVPLLSPSGVVVDARGNIYVVDSEYDSVNVFAPDRRLIAIWNNRKCSPAPTPDPCDGHRPGEFASPMQAAMDTQGNVYVTDAGNTRIQKFSPGGRLLDVIRLDGICGSGCFPAVVAVDRSGTIYAANFEGRKLYKLSPRGKLLATWGR